MGEYSTISTRAVFPPAHDNGHAWTQSPSGHPVIKDGVRDQAIGEEGQNLTFAREAAKTYLFPFIFINSLASSISTSPSKASSSLSSELIWSSRLPFFRKPKGTFSTELT